MRLCILLLAGIGSGLISAAASAQPEEKAEILVTSFRKDPITMSYAYVFRQFSWNLITHEIDPEDEVTYRRPANLPGCTQLRSWGIDQGRFMITAAGKELCSGPLSICDTTNYVIEAHEGGCKWKKTP